MLKITIDDIDKTILAEGANEIQNVLLGYEYDRSCLYRLVGYIVSTLEMIEDEEGNDEQKD